MKIVIINEQKSERQLVVGQAADQLGIGVEMLCGRVLQTEIETRPVPGDDGVNHIVPIEMSHLMYPAQSDGRGLPR